VEKAHLSRKLAVILHADVVGSTTLVQQNETLAHERIQAAFNNFSETITAYGGVAREIRGDALVAEFSRASDAVAAALAFQILNGKLNSTIEDDIRPKLRIGISLGEVIIADDTITGAGVVLAQRLEQLADPDGVVLQGSVSDTVPTRMPFNLESLGEQMLKGFDQPVRAFSASLQEGKTIPAPEVPSIPQARNPVNFKIADKPSIAVLPFDNMSGDPEQGFFADGIAEDIITALSRFHGLLVIARNSSFIYRGTSVDMRQVGRDLDVQYILEGSVRKASNRVRITVQLVEAHTGNHIWAERFDRPLEDVFEVQDEITTLVASTVGQQVGVAEYRSTLNHADQDLDYRGLLHRGMWHMNKVTEDECGKARKYAQQALDRNPEQVGGYSLMAYVNIIEFIYGWGGHRRAQLIPDAAEYATKGIRVDPDDEMAHTMMGAVYWMLGKHEAAVEECETVLRLNPNFSYACGILGIVHAYSGSAHYQQAVEYLEQAIRLSPNDPWLQFYFAHRGTAEFFNENYDSAINWYHRSIQRNPDLPNALRMLAAALALKGEYEKAKAALVEVLRTEPNCSISDLRQRLSQAFRHEHDFETYVRGLRLAGLPEE
jgi:adenylate cyclase